MSTTSWLRRQTCHAGLIYHQPRCARLPALHVSNSESISNCHYLTTHSTGSGLTKPCTHRRPFSTSPLQRLTTQPKPSATSSSAFPSFHPKPKSPYTSAQSRILTLSTPHIRETGFTLDTLALGAREAGLVDAAVNLFPEGSFALVRWHLYIQRVGLAARVDGLWGGRTEGRESSSTQPHMKPPGTGMKVRSLIWARLMANEEAGVTEKWQEALALSATPSNMSTTLHELALLSDEIWYLAGDTSVDTNWYTKRASLASVYAATELCMTTDRSAGFANTSDFLDRRLADVKILGQTWRSMSQWAAFTAMAGVNVLRSKGVRI